MTAKGVRPASVVIKEGLIEGIRAYEGTKGEDLGDSVLMPGLVDTHVHVNEPGRTDWEGFETATRAAAAGGITTIVDMPLNSNPVTTTLAALQKKRSAAKSKCLVDCGFWGGVVPGNLKELAPLVEAGIFGFKAFLVHSGIDDFPEIGEKNLEKAMTVLAEKGSLLLVHAELAQAPAGNGNPRLYAGYLRSRPKAWENDAVSLVARLSRETGCRTHIVHLSSAEALPVIAEAKRDGAPLTVETCPHYLTFCSEEIEDGHTEFKCAPPIREKENRERLWLALGEGLIDFVVSDHSPCAPELKKLESGDFAKSWGGISSLQFGLAAVWTEAKRRGFGLEDIARWMSANPSCFAGLEKKGAVAVGKDADFVVWDPEASFEVGPAMIQHRHKLTPYSGRRLLGKVQATYLRGERIYDRGRFPTRSSGRLLTKTSQERASHELHRVD